MSRKKFKKNITKTITLPFSAMESGWLDACSKKLERSYNATIFWLLEQFANGTIGYSGTMQDQTTQLQLLNAQLQILNAKMGGLPTEPIGSSSAVGGEESGIVKSSRLIDQRSSESKTRRRVRS